MILSCNKHNSLSETPKYQYAPVFLHPYTWLLDLGEGKGESLETEKQRVESSLARDLSRAAGRLAAQHGQGLKQEVLVSSGRASCLVWKVLEGGGSTAPQGCGYVLCPGHTWCRLPDRGCIPWVGEWGPLCMLRGIGTNDSYKSEFNLILKFNVYVS